MRGIGIALALGAALISGCSKAEPPRQFSQAALNSALADPARKDQSNADSRRHPGPLVALAGVKPGDKVLDLIPGGGYWTRIFSKIVGPTGKVYAVWPQAYASEATGDIAQTISMRTRKVVLTGRRYRSGDISEHRPPRRRAPNRHERTVISSRVGLPSARRSSPRSSVLRHP